MLKMRQTVRPHPLFLEEYSLSCAIIVCGKLRLRIEDLNSTNVIFTFRIKSSSKESRNVYVEM